MMPFPLASRAPRCAQCVRAARLLSTRATSASATAPSFSFASRTPANSSPIRDARINAQTRFFSHSSYLAAKRQPRQERFDPADLPDADFDPSMEDLLRGPDEEFDESRYENMEGMDGDKQSSSIASSTEEVPFYKLFPKTLPHGAPPAGPFQIDTRALHREFLQLQAAAHPDFHHAAGSKSSSKNKARAEALSSMINEAYRTLSSPLQRAQYLLKSKYGVDLTGDEATLMGGPSEADLLMEVMEVREQIEWASREEELEPIRAANDERMAESEAVLAAAFAADDADMARHEAIRLRYWVNVDEALKNWGEAAGVYFDHH
ncbi:fe-s protein assembly co-chaperone [Ophiostoma piceae UAMH 11346]|uniref:Fe-s protein assembly co-chaperone n=1 Tax=Ophiostoma piceae (strain UAMH 11346) TaxID=1262450 RepID=S3CHW9_OPHP1|nr:fe-s protein assembly co-chaperone [Ophiostoma piceae UAMH 11346]